MQKDEMQTHKLKATSCDNMMTVITCMRVGDYIKTHTKTDLNAQMSEEERSGNSIWGSKVIEMGTAGLS